MGTRLIYQESMSAELTDSIWSALPYFPISASLNVLLTITVIVWLVLYTKNSRNVAWITEIGSLCEAVVAIPTGLVPPTL